MAPIHASRRMNHDPNYASPKNALAKSRRRARRRGAGPLIDCRVLVSAMMALVMVVGASTVANPSQIFSNAAAIIDYGGFQEGSESKPEKQVADTFKSIPDVPVTMTANHGGSHTTVGEIDVNRHAFLQIHVSVIGIPCTGCNIGNSSLSMSPGNVLKSTGKWLVTVNEIPRSSDQSAINIERLLNLEWSHAGEFVHGKQRLGLLLPLQTPTGWSSEERTLLVTLMNELSNRARTIATRRLANVPRSRTPAMEKTHRQGNLVVSLTLRYNTTIVTSKEHMHETTSTIQGFDIPSDEGSTWTMLVATTAFTILSVSVLSYSIASKRADNREVPERVTNDFREGARHIENPAIEHEEDIDEPQLPPELERKDMDIPDFFRVHEQVVVEKAASSNASVGSDSDDDYAVVIPVQRRVDSTASKTHRKGNNSFIVQGQRNSDRVTDAWFESEQALQFASRPPGQTAPPSSPREEPRHSAVGEQDRTDENFVAQPDPTEDVVAETQNQHPSGEQSQGDSQAPNHVLEESQEVGNIEETAQKSDDPPTIVNRELAEGGGENPHAVSREDSFDKGRGDVCLQNFENKAKSGAMTHLVTVGVLDGQDLASVDQKDSMLCANHVAVSGEDGTVLVSALDTKVDDSSFSLDATDFSTEKSKCDRPSQYIDDNLEPVSGALREFTGGSNATQQSLDVKGESDTTCLGRQCTEISGLPTDECNIPIQHLSPVNPLLPETRRDEPNRSKSARSTLVGNRANNADERSQRESSYVSTLPSDSDISSAENVLATQEAVETGKALNQVNPIRAGHSQVTKRKHGAVLDSQETNGDSENDSSQAKKPRLDDTPIVDEAFYVWPTLWSHLSKVGWKVVRARNPNHDWYYVRPGRGTQEGTAGIDYFLSPEEVVDFARTKNTKRQFTTTESDCVKVPEKALARLNEAESQQPGSSSEKHAVSIKQGEAFRLEDNTLYESSEKLSSRNEPDSSVVVLEVSPSSTQDALWDTANDCATRTSPKSIPNSFRVKPKCQIAVPSSRRKRKRNSVKAFVPDIVPSTSLISVSREIEAPVWQFEQSTHTKATA